MGKTEWQANALLSNIRIRNKKTSPTNTTTKQLSYRGNHGHFFFVNLFGSDFNIMEYDIFVIKKEYIVLHMEFEWAPQSEPLTGP